MKTKTISISGIILISIFILALTSPFAKSQTPAFPGAEGFGKHVSGGRGGEVYYVTNTNNSGTGSLRDALTTRNFSNSVLIPRTVVFNVSGNIVISSSIEVTRGDLTIAGQTAPGEGVCLRSNGAFNIFLLRIKADNIIIRYLRFRRGPSNQIGEVNGDNFDILNASNLMFDHCSFSWSTDELVNSWPSTFSENVTFQYCIFSEALYNSTHEKGNHSMGPLIGESSRNYTFYRNIIANNNGRNPRIAVTTGGTFQLINNIMYNCCYVAQLVGFENQEMKTNAIGNLIKWGPNSCDNNRNNILLEGSAKVFVSDNLTPFRNEGDDEWLATSEYMKRTPALTTFKSDTRFPDPSLPIISPLALYEYLPQQAGAIIVRNSDGTFATFRDAVDTRNINDVKSGTSRIGITGRRLDHPNDVGGWPELASVTAPFDSDKDGMPDAWELANGLGHNDPSDGNLLNLSTEGYTNLEVYLNNFLSTSVNYDSMKNTGLEVYPNPSDGQTLQIILHGERTNNVAISIYTTLGARVYHTIQPWQDEITIEPGIRSGLYLVRVNYRTSRIVVN